MNKLTLNCIVPFKGVPTIEEVGDEEGCLAWSVNPRGWAIVTGETARFLNRAAKVYNGVDSEYFAHWLPLPPAPESNSGESKVRQREKVKRSKTFFGFQARNEVTDELRFLGFTLTIPQKYNGDADEWFSDLFDSNDFTEFFENQEMEYGIHDGCFGEWSIVYDSYEVEYDRLEELMWGWRNYFVGLLGESNVGSVMELPRDVWESNSDDEKIFELLNESK